MEELKTKTDAELTLAERLERRDRIAATKAQILADQQSNAKRDAKALARERAWFRENGQRNA